MQSTEKYARVAAMISALETVKKELAAEILSAAEQTGAVSYATPLGRVNVVSKNPVIEIIDLEKLAATLPENEVMLVPRAWAADTALKRLVIVDGEAVDRLTGEIASWARVRPAGDPFIAWPSSEAQKQAKQDTEEGLRAALDQVLAAARLVPEVTP